MTPLPVNFLRSVPVWSRLWPLVALLLAVAVAYEGWLATSLARRLRDLRALVEANERQGSVQAAEAKRAALGASEIVPPYRADAARLAAVSAFPLARVFAAVESAQVIGVRITELEILPAEYVVRAEVDFSDYPRLLEYVDALNAGEGFRRWTIRVTQVGQLPDAHASARIESRWSEHER